MKKCLAFLTSSKEHFAIVQTYCQNEIFVVCTMWKPGNFFKSISRHVVTKRIVTYLRLLFSVHHQKQIEQFSQNMLAMLKKRVAQYYWCNCQHKLPIFFQFTFAYFSFHLPQRSLSYHYQNCNRHYLYCIHQLQTDLYAAYFSQLYFSSLPL